MLFSSFLLESRSQPRRRDGPAGTYMYICIYDINPYLEVTLATVVLDICSSTTYQLGS